VRNCHFRSLRFVDWSPFLFIADLRYLFRRRFKYDIEPIIKFSIITVLNNSTVRYGNGTDYLLRMRIILQYWELKHGVRDHGIFWFCRFNYNLPVVDRGRQSLLAACSSQLAARVCNRCPYGTLLVTALPATIIPWYFFYLLMTIYAL
jgi:hypothetical protein